MSKFILETFLLPPLSNQEPKEIIILCHGYGGDGKDISVLANGWRRFLPNAVFLCPNAPEVCEINPKGFQWFNLDSENEDIILEKSFIAENKLSIFLDEVLKEFKLNPNNMALVGFSQGCMIGLQTVIKKKYKINCLVGYSGKIIHKNHLSQNIISKPKIFLMHGDRDLIVPPVHLLEAKDFFQEHNYKIKTKIFKDCEHNIPVEGSSAGLEFLKKNLL